MYRRLSIIAGILGIGILALNSIANALYLYVSIPWFDMFMHTLGGAFTAVMIGALVVKRGLTSRESFITILLTVFIVGLGWEYYEYIVQFFIKGANLANISDSLSDVICDMFGGTIAASFVILLQRRYNRA